MKRIIFLIVFIIFLVGCKKEINITPPTILIQNPLVSVLDTLFINIDEYADIEGVRINTDYYDWFVEDSEGVTIKDDFPDSSVINWVPQEAGFFLVKVKIGYDNNKSIIAIKEITVTESAASLQKKIVGHWKGTGICNDGEWGVDLSIDSSGHYYGTADYHSFDPGCSKDVFNSGQLVYHTNWRVDSCGVPGDVACQRFEIKEVINNKGFGVIWIGFIYFNNGVYSYDFCYNRYDIENMEISSKGNQLYFEFNPNDYKYSIWEKKFELTRQ